MFMVDLQCDYSLIVTCGSALFTAVYVQYLVKQ